MLLYAASLPNTVAKQSQDMQLLQQHRGGHTPSEGVVGSSLVVICIRLQQGAQVPQLDGLVFAVTDQVAAIPLRVQMSQAISVPHQQTSRLGAAQVAPVPYLQHVLCQQCM